MTERAAEQLRGRVIVVGPGGRLLADSAGEERRRDRLLARARRSRARSTAKSSQEERHSETLDETILATAVPVRESGTGDTIGAVRMTQSVDAVNRATWRATLGLVAIGLLVLVLGLAAGALIAGQVAGPVRRLDAGGAACRRGRPVGPREGRGQHRAAAARAHVQRHDRAARAAASSASATSSPTPRTSSARRSAGCGCGSRRRAPRPPTPTPTRRSTPACAELDRLSAMVSELLVLSQAGEVDAPPERVDLEDAAAPRRGALGRRRGRARPLLAATPADGFAPPADLDRAIDALDRERDPLRQRRGRGLRAAGRARGARPRPRPRATRTWRRSSSASTAAPPAAPGRTAPASGCRSPASWPAAGAATSRSPTVTRAARGPR